MLILSYSPLSNTYNWQNTMNDSTSNTWNFVVLGDTRQKWGYWDENRQHYSHDNSSNPTRATLVNSIVKIIQI